MTWTIVKKEFYSHLLTFRLWICVVLCFILVPFVLQVSIKRYQEKVNNYQTEIRHFDRETHEAHTYSFVRPTVVRPPQVLSILCSGIEDNVGNEIPIRIGQIPFIPTGKLYGRDNPFLGAFTSIDTMFVILIVIGLFSILLTYDVISGEKERGVLRQAFTNPIYRRHLLLGKYLGALCIVAPLLFCIFVIATLMMLFSVGIHFDTGDLLRFSFLFVASVFYSSVFILLGLLVSCRTNHSSNSLMFGVFAWVVLAIIIPNASSHVARQFYPVQSAKTLDDNISKIESDRENRIQAEAPPEPRQEEGLRNFYYREGDDGQFIMANNTKEAYDFYLSYLDIDLKFRCEYAEKIWDVQRGYLDAIIKQQQLQSRLGCLSPAYLLQQASEAIACVSSTNMENFLFQARLYRLAFVQYLNQERRTHPYLYITPDKEIRTFQQWLPYWTDGKYHNNDELFKGRTWDEAINLFDAVFDTAGRMDSYRVNNFPKVDLSGMPVFTVQSLPVSEAIGASLFPITLLLIVSAILFTLAHRSFIVYDLR